MYQTKSCCVRLHLFSQSCDNSLFLTAFDSFKCLILKISGSYSHKLHLMAQQSHRVRNWTVIKCQRMDWLLLENTGNLNFAKHGAFKRDRPFEWQSPVFCVFPAFLRLKLWTSRLTQQQQRHAHSAGTWTAWIKSWGKNISPREGNCICCHAVHVRRVQEAEFS